MSFHVGFLPYFLTDLYVPVIILKRNMPSSILEENILRLYPKLGHSDVIFIVLAM